MAPNRAPLQQPLVEFAVLLALVVGGAVVVGSVPNVVSASVSPLLQGFLLVVLGCCGVGWVLWVSPDEQRRASMGAGLGGGLGALVGTTYLGGGVQGALGAGLGAGLFAAGFLLWSRVRK
ncbi:hypothetical protein [Halorientalis marina]|jgi:hypothetical protein|uniref:hypothetical protein n=1 Tax=Halorientalis marina TaxID=2931976 RepID=UPI001FF25A75|nr:hypothetical protein [Halorientalis marina]